MAEEVEFLVEDEDEKFSRWEAHLEMTQSDVLKGAAVWPHERLVNEALDS